MRASPLIVTAAVLAAGCIASDPGPAVQCETTQDCNHARGEVCAEGICYGDPPDNIGFAAVLVPPDGRGDLAVTELTELAIAPDGTISGLDFAPAVLVSGRVLLACPSEPVDYPCGEAASIAAQIVVERAASFPGGPGWSRQVTAVAGIGPGSPAFSFRLPRDAGASYRVTITPEASDVTASGTAIRSPAELAPPRQLAIGAGEDQSVEWYLGEPRELKQIVGCVENQLGNGAPFAGMRVTAFGRWIELGRLERASSLAVTDAKGCFDLRVPRRMLDRFDVVVKPAPGTTLPSLRLFDELVPDPVDGELPIHEISPALVMPNAPAPIQFRLPVKAPDSGGGQAAVTGADVRMATSFPVPGQTDAPGRVVAVTYETRAVTSGPETAEPGVAEILLYPGEATQNRSYAVSVVPAAGSEFAASWSSVVSVGTAGGTLAPVVLGRRIGVAARVTAADGAAIKDTPVEVRLSSLFRFKADDAAAAAGRALPLGATTTGTDGGLFLWLDRQVLDAPAFYDLEIEPAFFVAPRWSFDGIELPAVGDAIDLGELRLPEASYARGPIRGPDGVPVAGAELRIYQLPGEGLCPLAHEVEPTDCEPPAPLRGSFISDAEGVVRPVLPDP
jgi:hypothetical protein